MFKKIIFLTAAICETMNAQYPQLKQKKHIPTQEEAAQGRSSLILAYQQSESVSGLKKGMPSHLTVPIASRAGSPVHTYNKTAQAAIDNKWTRDIVIPFYIPQDSQEGNTISPENKNLPKRPIFTPKSEYTHSIILSTSSQSQSSPAYSIKSPKKKHLSLADLYENKKEKDEPKKRMADKTGAKAFFEKIETLKKDFTLLLINPPASIIHEAMHANIPVGELIKKTFILNHARIAHSHKDILNNKHPLANAENIWKEICVQSVHYGKKDQKNCCSLQ